MQKEQFYISLFNNKKIGDDGAYIDGFVYSTDAFCEGVHFRREWMGLEQIAKKAIAVNISDAIAMNAKPLYALVSIAIPKDFSKHELKKLAKGFNEAAKEYNVQIIGGDTVASDRLDISITIISKTKKPLFRKPLKVGYLIGYTGKLGSVRRDLLRLFRRQRPNVKSKFFKPQLRSAFMKRCARILKTSMDISDGLFDDLGKLSHLNKKGFVLFNHIPKEVGCSGEEYEILFAIDPKDRIALERRAKISRTKVDFIAKVVRGTFRNPCKAHHF